MKGVHKALVTILGADGAAVAVFQSPSVLRSRADIIKSASEALSAHLGKEGMLQSIRNDPISLRKAGDKIHQTAAAIKGLLGDSEGTDLLKAKPRLFHSSATYIEANFEALCAAFDRELVLKAVCSRANLLYDRTAANKAVKTGMLQSGQ